MYVPPPGTDDPFWIDRWFIEPRLNRVTSQDGCETVEPRVMALLTVLASHPGQVITRESLLDTVWGDTVVNEAALTRALSELRKLFHDDARTPRVVETIRGRGYRLIAPIVSHAPPPRSSPRRLRAIGIAVILFVLVSALFIIGLRDRAPADAPAPISRTGIIPVTSYTGREIQPAISPEGTRIAFAWNGRGNGYDLYVKQQGSETALQLTDNPDFEGHPSWSPDGTSIAFFRGGEAMGVYVVPSLGGPARRLFTTQTWIQSLDWSPDGRMIVFSARHPEDASFQLFLFDLESDRISSLQGPEEAVHDDVFPRFSPEGDRIAFVRRTQAGNGHIVLHALDSRSEDRIATDRFGIEGLDWLQDDIVFSTSQSGSHELWRVDVMRGTLSYIDAPGGPVHHPSVSPLNDAVVYQEERFDRNVWRITLDEPGGRVTSHGPILNSTRWDCEASLNPGGDRLAFTSERSGHLELWLSDADGGMPVQISRFEGPFVGNPRWSPDGRMIAFNAAPEGVAAVYVFEAAGGPPQRLTSPDWNARVLGWTADGRHVYFSSAREGVWHVWQVDARGGEPVRVNDVPGPSAAESTDGRTLYTTRTGVHGVWRHDLVDGLIAGGGEQILSRLSPQDVHNWVVHDGGMFFLTRGAAGPSIAHLEFDTGEISVVADVPKIATPSLAVSQDGRTVYYSRRGRMESDLVAIAL